MRVTRLFPASVLLILIFSASGCMALSSPDGQAELEGQGATFIEPVMKVWTDHYLETKTDGLVVVNYQGTGSGAGIQQLTNKTVDFACSDAPMNRKQLAAAMEAGGPVVHIPLVLGAVVPVYHLDGIDQPLNFTGEVLAEIYLGSIRQWNHPALQAINPGVQLPALGIQPVFRSDSSGTSAIFTEYLCKVSPRFKAEIGSSTSPSFPQGVGIGKPKTDGVAGHIANTNGAIGYIELTYALDKQAQYGAVRNQSGVYVLADLPSITAAALAALSEARTEEPYSLHQLTYSLTNTEGSSAYPISALSYGLFYQNQGNPQTRKALIEFLKWCASDEGQDLAERRNYARMPEELATAIHELLTKLEP